MEQIKCTKCETDFTPRRKNQRFCSARCRSAHNALQHAYRTGRIKRPGVGSGGAQWGEDNHMYRTGIGSYSKRAFDHYGRECQRCESDRYLVVHHIDHDRTNNSLTNLEVLCKSCHQRHHEIRDAQGRYAYHGKEVTK